MSQKRVEDAQQFMKLESRFSKIVIDNSFFNRQLDIDFLTLK